MDFEISQIQVFTFIFFMQQLSGNSLDKFSKSCRVSHEESNKIGFAFFWFSTIFYEFYKIQQKPLTIWDSVLR
jgi:hypothetical protein